MINRFARPQMRHREEAIDLRIEHDSRLLEAIDKVLPHPRPPHRRLLVRYRPQRAPERIAVFRQPRIANQQVRRRSPHLFDYVAAHRPQVAKVGDVRMHRERIDALLAQLRNRSNAST